MEIFNKFSWKSSVDIWDHILKTYANIFRKEFDILLELTSEELREAL